jgi:hypothetical protein
VPGSVGCENPDEGAVETDDTRDRAPVMDTGPQIGTAGSGGIVDATSDGGAVIIGDVASGSDAGSGVGVDDEETVDGGG